MIRTLMAAALVLAAAAASAAPASAAKKPVLDLNGDGLVGCLDQMYILSNYGLFVPKDKKNPATRSDINHDGQVDDADNFRFWALSQELGLWTGDSGC